LRRSGAALFDVELGGVVDHDAVATRVVHLQPLLARLYEGARRGGDYYA
jgi:hypothetical protein